MNNNMNLVLIAPCGCCRSAAVMQGLSIKDAAKLVEGWSKHVGNQQGWKIEQRDSAWVRENFHTEAKCPHKPAQVEMFRD